MKRNLLIWFTILSSLIGCVDDKSNTRIEELNEVTIGALQENIVRNWEVIYKFLFQSQHAPVMNLN